MEQNEKIGYKDIFKQKEYMKMMVAALINRFGDSIDAIASTWIVYELTGSAVWSAVIFGVNKVPSVFVTPLAGAWVEGRNKKVIMIITDLIRAFCVAFVASGYLLGFLQPWMLLVTTCIISTVEAFRGPAGSALTPRVLQAEYYEYGMSLMSTFSSVTEPKSIPTVNAALNNESISAPPCKISSTIGASRLFSGTKIPFIKRTTTIK